MSARTLMRLIKVAIAGYLAIGVALWCFALLRQPGHHGPIEWLRAIPRFVLSWPAELPGLFG